jgi:hypothetical protein
MCTSPPRRSKTSMVTSSTAGSSRTAYAVSFAGPDAGRSVKRGEPSARDSTWSAKIRLKAGTCRRLKSTQALPRLRHGSSPTSWSPTAG